MARPAVNRKPRIRPVPAPQCAELDSYLKGE
ncbi:hypothetical protein WP1_275 [Pseudomonas phage WP1]